MTRHIGRLMFTAATSICLGVWFLGDANARPVTVTDLLDATVATDWRTPDPDNTLYLELSSGRVIIELASRVAPRHVANIKALVRSHYFDGLAILRVQDNYVVQWADPDTHRPVPAGVTMVAPELVADPAAYARFEPVPDHDLYAPQVGFIDGFPAGRDSHTRTAWLVHCYGMVGVGRDDPPESDGTEMYAVIGHAPRQLDRNVALVGRVLQGIERLSSLPRGGGDMGFYLKSEPLVPIVAMRIAADLPVESRASIEVLRTDSAAFRKIIDQRRDRHEPWFQYHPGKIDLCNIPLPVRTAPATR